LKCLILQDVADENDEISEKKEKEDTSIIPSVLDCFALLKRGEKKIDSSQQVIS